ncbi:MAG: GNAT family N-acetyltransferase, partial [Rhodomicrobium sp.]|nr:GNAT family N-acetyltransferase [Rhodomicrobium sp.]
MSKHNIIYRTEDDRTILLEFLPSIITLANEHKEALGFLPENAYRDAIQRRRLVAMRAGSSANEKTLAGFILFSGVFPNARIQQVAVVDKFRRGCVGSALLNHVISRLEAQGYLTVSAAVASDLSAAQKFYSRNGFVARRTIPGGRARKRTLILYARDLETKSLLSVLEPQQNSPSTIDLGLRKRNAWRAPLFAVDLNVIFDVTKMNRPREPLAGKLIAAALDHQIRLAVTPEFIVELERQIKG